MCRRENECGSLDLSQPNGPPWPVIGMINTHIRHVYCGEICLEKYLPSDSVKGRRVARRLIQYTFSDVSHVMNNFNFCHLDKFHFTWKALMRAVLEEGAAKDLLERKNN
jgi:hypothetical protein